LIIRTLSRTLSKIDSSGTGAGCKMGVSSESSKAGRILRAKTFFTKMPAVPPIATEKVDQILVLKIF